LPPRLDKLHPCQILFPRHLVIESTPLGLRAGRDAGVARHFHDISERMAADTRLDIELVPPVF
jgi:hypothetical protein